MTEASFEYYITRTSEMTLKIITSQLRQNSKFTDCISKVTY